MEDSVNNQNYKPKNLRTFWIIWAGQVISMLGSGLTSFSLGVWIYDQTGQATPFALTALFSTLPALIMMPLGGAIADRYNRRILMILSDTGSGVITVLTALLLFLGVLQIWHIYLLAAFNSIFSAFQGPAYSASITMLVPKKDLARSSGIMQMGQAATGILTPILAGGLYGLIGLRGVMVIDAVSYIFAVSALIIVRIPQPKRIVRDGDLEHKKTSLLTDAVFGWNYLRTLPGLFGLLLYFASVNFFLSLSSILSGPLVLSFGSATDLGVVQMVSSASLLIGSVIISAWGGPKKQKIPALIGFIALAVTGLIISGLKADIWIISIGRVVMLFFIPFASALSQSVFQTKVAPEIQGRVFSIRGMIAQSMMPLAFLLSGPLADKVFDPLMAASGALGSTFIGQILGTGPGRGIGLIMVISCILMWGTSILAFIHPRIRNLENEIPDMIPDDSGAILEESY
jgi:DHA3 family macrolide efflux protein-like MFS transporter